MIVARGRDTPIKRKNRGNSREKTKGGRTKGRTLTRAYWRDLTRNPERSSRRQTRGVFSKKSARRRLMIPARGSKKGGYGRESEGEGEISVQVEKKTPRSDLSLSSFRAHGRTSVCADSRVSSRALRRVGGVPLPPPVSCVCVHRRRGEDVTYNANAHRGIARNNYKHRGVTINLPIRLDNNKRITGMRCGAPQVGRGGEGDKKSGAAKARGGEHPPSA